jgi:hypothetical protein
MENSVIEDAVDGDGCANAKGERKDRGQRETGVTEDLTERKTEILCISASCGGTAGPFLNCEAL